MKYASLIIAVATVLGTLLALGADCHAGKTIHGCAPINLAGHRAAGSTAAQLPTPAAGRVAPGLAAVIPTPASSQAQPVFVTVDAAGVAIEVRIEDPR